MSALQKSSPLFQALRRGGSTFGAWHMLPGAQLARTLASTGVEWIYIDAEHGNIADSDMHTSVLAITGVETCSPIIRIPAAEPWMVKRALDAGAHGIMVPLLQNALEVKAFVAAAKFPPVGKRGFGSPFPIHSFRGVSSSVQYLQEANDALITIVQIETREALANVRDIAAVDGLDCLFIGPFDLGNNIGYPIVGEMHSELKSAILKVKDAAIEHGKSVGIYCTSGAQARDYADQGFHMISVSSDVMAIQQQVTEQLTTAKGSLAHSALNTAKSVAEKITGPYGIIYCNSMAKKALKEAERQRNRQSYMD